MRSTLLLLAAVLLVGCSSTRMLKGPLAPTDISEINSLCANGCSAEVVFSEAAGSIDMNEDPDSIYQRLKHRDVRLRLKDSTDLRGQVSRLVAEPRTWLVGPELSSGSITDTVHLSISSVEAIWVAERSGTIRTRSLRGDTILIYVDGGRALPVTSVMQIGIRSRETSTLPLTIGASLLMGAAGAVGGFFGTYYATCSEEESAWDDGCDDSLNFAIGAMLAGAALGTAGGAHLGNQRRGSFGLDLAASLVGIGAGAALASVLEDSGGEWIVAVAGLPPVVLPVLAERWLGGRRARNRLSGGVGAGPGGPAFSLAINF